MDPNTAVITALHYMDYNEIYEGNGSDLAIYFRTAGGSMAYLTTGTSYVYKSIQPGTLKAACWNQDSSAITARCDFFYA